MKNVEIEGMKCAVRWNSPSTPSPQGSTSIFCGDYSLFHFISSASTLSFHSTLSPSTISSPLQALPQNMSRLPGFLRLDSATTTRAAVEAQHQLFAQLNNMERQRAQAAFTPSSPFSVLHAVQDSTREQNRCKPFAHISCSLTYKSPSDYV